MIAGGVEDTVTLVEIIALYPNDEVLSRTLGDGANIVKLLDLGKGTPTDWVKDVK